MNITSKHMLTSAGYASFALAIFQAVISLSPSWSMYFGAEPKLVNNYALLVTMGEFIAIIFAIFGLYAFSGAGRIRRLPFLRSALIIVGGIFILRGLVVIPQLLIVTNVIHCKACVPVRMIVSSIVSLAIGAVYLMGVAKGWKSMKPPALNAS